MPEKTELKSTVIPITPGRHELQIAAVAGLPEDRAESEAERQQVQARLAQRNHNLYPRAHITLQFPQPQDVNRTHTNPPTLVAPQRRHILATCRIAALASAPSSRSEEPVSARNASSSESVPVCSFSSVDVPWATMLP